MGCDSSIEGLLHAMLVVFSLMLGILLWFAPPIVQWGVLIAVVVLMVFLVSAFSGLPEKLVEPVKEISEKEQRGEHVPLHQVFTSFLKLPLIFLTYIAGVYLIILLLKAVVIYSIIKWSLSKGGVLRWLGTLRHIFFGSIA